MYPKSSEHYTVWQTCLREKQSSILQWIGQSVIVALPPQTSLDIYCWIRGAISRYQAAKLYPHASLTGRASGATINTILQPSVLRSCPSFLSIPPKGSWGIFKVQPTQHGRLTR